MTRVLYIFAAGLGLILLVGLAPPAAAEKGKRPNTGAQGQSQVFVNGSALTREQVASLERAYGVPVQAGRYWYDQTAGLWGKEGMSPTGQIHPGLNLGGTLKADASAGKTGVFINGRELTAVEVTQLQHMFGVILPGRYWLNAQGIGGYEGGPAQFNLAASAGKKGGGMYGGWNRTTPGGHLGGDDNCSYFFDPNSGASVMNCK